MSDEGWWMVQTMVRPCLCARLARSLATWPRESSDTYIGITSNGRRSVRGTGRTTATKQSVLAYFFLALYAVAESRPLVGSSRYRMAGLVTAAMPRLSRRFSPPERGHKGRAGLVVRAQPPLLTACIRRRRDLSLPCPDATQHGRPNNTDWTVSRLFCRLRSPAGMYRHAPY